MWTTNLYFQPRFLSWVTDNTPSCFWASPLRYIADTSNFHNQLELIIFPSPPFNLPLPHDTLSIVLPGNLALKLETWKSCLIPLSFSLLPSTFFYTTNREVLLILGLKFSQIWLLPIFATKCLPKLLPMFTSSYYNSR